jgi:sugar lactone lactonase YvrE
VPSEIVVSAGDQQNGVPGDTLPLPVDVVVLDGTGSAVANVVVTFSVSGAGQTLPQSVTTALDGHARALVRLPSQSLTKVTITASCSTVNATLSATTGPRLLATFGNASAAHGAVRPDGTYVGLPLLGDTPPGFGYDLFAADGTLTGPLGPLQGKMSIPGLYYDLSSVVSTPDQKLYFRSYISSVDNSMYIFQLDSGLNLTQFTRVTSPSQNFSLAGPMTVDASGDFYIAEDPGSVAVLVFDPSGKQINKIVVGGSVLGLAINHSGNLVAFVSDQDDVFSFKEYSMAGTLVNSSSPLPVSSLATFAQDSAGDYLVLDNAGPLYKFDQNYNSISIVSLAGLPYGSGEAVVSGGDASGNSYISSRMDMGLLKYDQNGNLVSVTAWPVQNLCPGCPAPAYTNQLISPTAMVVDNATSDLYVADNSASIKMGISILRYTNQQFAARLIMPQGVFPDDIAIDSARELYLADYHSNSVHVLDLSGNVLRTIQGPQVGVPISITIDANDNKYILDSSTISIHVLDPSDRLLATLALNVPPPLQGNLRVGGDGNLFLVEWTGGPQSTVMKLATDGTELFSVTYLGSEFFPYWATADTQGNMFLAGPDQLRILDAKGNKLGEFDYSNGLFPYPPTPCGLASQGDTAYTCYFNRINAFSAQ